ncbi:cold-shock protein [Bacteroidota bacterium]
MRNQIFEGTIKVIFEDKGYGFIESTEHPEGVFFLISQIKRTISEGDHVAYEAHPSRKNPDKSEARFIRQVFVTKNNVKVLEGIKSTIHAKAREVLHEILPTIELETSKEIIEFQATLDNHTGYQYCIETNDNDKIIYAKRWKKSTYYKFVIDKKPAETNEFTIIFKQIEDYYLVLTAFFGPKAEPFPWDKNANIEKSLNFWKNHAIVLAGEFDIKPETITGILPEELEEYFPDSL